MALSLLTNDVFSKTSVNSSHINLIWSWQYCTYSDYRICTDFHFLHQANKCMEEFCKYLVNLNDNLCANLCQLFQFWTFFAFVTFRKLVVIRWADMAQTISTAYQKKYSGNLQIESFCKFLIRKMENSLLIWTKKNLSTNSPWGFELIFDTKN